MSVSPSYLQMPKIFFRHDKVKFALPKVEFIMTSYSDFVKLYKRLVTVTKRRVSFNFDSERYIHLYTIQRVICRFCDVISKSITSDLPSMSDHVYESIINTPNPPSTTSLIPVSCVSSHPQFLMSYMLPPSALDMVMLCSE